MEMSRVSRDEFEKSYRAFLYQHKEWNMMFLAEIYLAALIRLADESGYIDNMSNPRVYDAHVANMDEGSDGVNDGKFNNFVAIAIHSIYMEMLHLGYLEHAPRNGNPGAYLCLPFSKEER